MRRLARRALSTGQPVVIWEDASSTAAARPTGTGLAASPIGLALPEAERFLPGMRTSAPPWRGRGVISECKSRDLQLLVNNYTAPALAAALRDREDNLHVCAQLLGRVTRPPPPAPSPPPPTRRRRPRAHATPAPFTSLSSGQARRAPPCCGRSGAT